MKTFRSCLSLAALVGAVGLVEPPQAQARIHATSSLSHSDKQVLKQAQFANMLLTKEQGSIDHQQRYIDIQNGLIAKENLLSQLVPVNNQQALGIQRQFTKMGIQINKIQSALNAGQGRLLNQEANVSNTLNTLSQVNVTSPQLAQQLADFLTLANQRAALQAGEIAQILNRPPATPFVPF